MTDCVMIKWIFFVSEISHSTIQQIWLKMPIRGPKFRFWGVSILKHYNHSYAEGTSLREIASYEPLCVKIGSVVLL